LFKLSNFFDVYSLSLNKTGEELCGDKVKVLKTPAKTMIVLSDGLGSGVKANILATLTTEIIINMLKADAPLRDVIETVIGTLPVCQVRQIAYATFTIVQIDNATGHFNVINFDNPPLLYFKKGRLFKFERVSEKILDKTVTIVNGCLERGDFLGLITDGIPYAGLGVTYNFGWGWKNVAKFVQDLLIRRPRTAQEVVTQIIAKTRILYQGDVGDDATFAGLYVRPKNALIIFTGPPLDPKTDSMYAEKVLDFQGRKVICGGTTGNIVGEYLGETIEINISTLRKEVPPIGSLKGIDLVTEGIITVSKVIEYLRDYGDHISRLPPDNNGAVLLTREILQADLIYFLVGQKVNEFYQNPLLPKNVSIRKNLVKEIAEILQGMHKEVIVEYC
jgi:hypothetical protein